MPPLRSRRDKKGQETRAIGTSTRRSRSSLRSEGCLPLRHKRWRKACCAQCSLWVRTHSHRRAVDHWRRCRISRADCSHELRVCLHLCTCGCLPLGRVSLMISCALLCVNARVHVRLRPQHVPCLCLLRVRGACKAFMSVTRAFGTRKFRATRKQRAHGQRLPQPPAGQSIGCSQVLLQMPPWDTS